MNKYPYFIVQRRVGRTPCPPQYRHTVLERQFASGRIGGTKLEEEIRYTAKETQLAALRAGRDHAEVLVYVVERPNSPRLQVHNHQGRIWTIDGRKHANIDSIDELLKWPKSPSSTDANNP